MDQTKSKKNVSLVKRQHHHHRQDKHHQTSINIFNYIDFGFTLIGASKVTLSQKTQEELGCVVGKHVTCDHPWKFVAKELLMDNITFDDESEFLPLRLDIVVYTRDSLLLVYIPDEISDHDDFVLYLTEETEDKVVENIKRFQKAVEGIVARTLYRSIHSWKSLGSEKEIEECTEKTNRALLIVEIESTYPIMFRKILFRYRQPEDVRDGYVELLHGKLILPHVRKMLQTIAIQAAPYKRDTIIQTLCKYKQNAGTQSNFEYKTIKSILPTFQKTSVTSFNLDFICDQVAVSSKINFFTNDYLQLKEMGKYLKPPKETKNIELITFSEFSVAKNNLISSVCWHPILTGTVAIAYSPEASNVYHTSKPKAHQPQITEDKINTVLIWCTNDELHPKLRLVCFKQITCISFCPFDENIIVGTCTNGQIVLWDIKNKLEEVEEAKIFTYQERKHKILMSMHMAWMKDVQDKSQVLITAESDLRYSHGWPAVSIQWLPPYCRINKSGKYEVIAEDEPESMQIVTCALDGSIFFWDLLAKPISHEHYMGFQNTSRNIARPSGLVIATSPFRVLNRILRPIYKLNATSSKKIKPMLTVSLVSQPINISYEQGTRRKLELTERVAFNVRVKRPSLDISIKPEIYCGTCDGYFFKATWEGHNISQGGANIDQESLIINSIGRYHDGPVTSVSRHPYMHDVYLTVGGKVFAIWTDDLKDRPVFWRKSAQKYLHGAWEAVILHCIILSTDDGRKEVWVLTRRCDTFYYEQHLSGRPVLGIYLYPFTLADDEFLGVAHSDGTFGMIFLPGQLKQLCYQKDSLRKLLDREIERKKIFIAWQEKWNENHQETIRKKNTEINVYKHEKLLNQKLKEERRQEMQLQREEEERKMLLAQKRAKPKPGQYFNYAREQWRIKEEENTRKMLQARAQLPSREYLEQLKVPLKQIQAEEEKLKQKLKSRLQNSEKIFQEAVAMKFPDAIKKEPPPVLDPYAGGDTMSVKNECIFEYMIDSKEAEKFIQENRYQYVFRWDDLLQVNMDRRRSELYLGTKSHRERYFRKKFTKLLERQEKSFDFPCE